MIARSGAGAVVIGSDEQDTEDVEIERWAALARAVLDAEGCRGELGLTFISERAMTGLNAEHMGFDRPTDVLAFPLDARPDGPALADELRLLGDVVVCPVAARRNADERGVALDDELALLVVHGVLHVLGHDHAEGNERAVMQERERHHLVRFHT
ncbi:MAG: rRNA maturation RNase YbeY [Actinomycetia bacterium]|nr:rRNA maturation RNase YbeY [Actinomycetes bacterium]